MTEMKRPWWIEDRGSMRMVKGLPKCPKCGGPADINGYWADRLSVGCCGKTLLGTTLEAALDAWCVWVEQGTDAVHRQCHACNEPEHAGRKLFERLSDSSGGFRLTCGDCLASGLSLAKQPILDRVPHAGQHAWATPGWEDVG